MRQLTLVGRRYCSLCDTMRQAIHEAANRQNVQIQLAEVDLDEHRTHEARFGEWVPVLMLGDMDSGTAICHYHFDETKWLAAMDGATVIETLGEAQGLS